ncbi:MAG: hypothetical protein D6E12_07395 [Desulfovibrio sp.]|nr:MAG: hypothetical protein D6E12_07395 [Desulfovibrio sp.]
MPLDTPTPDEGLENLKPAHPSPEPAPDTQGKDLLIRDLVEPVPYVGPSTIVQDVKDHLGGDNPANSVVVVNGNRPVGLIMSLHLGHILSREFGAAVYEKRPVDQVMDPEPLIVEGDALVEMVANKSMQRQVAKIFDHIIVTQKGVLEGIVSVPSILKALADLQANRHQSALAVNKKLKLAKSKTDSMNRALRNAFDRLQEVDKMKTDFLSMVSHELRTPLTSVLGFGEIAQMKLKEEIIPKLTVEQQAAIKAAHTVESNIEIILSESERLTALVNDVLDIAKLEAGKIEWKKRPLNINDVVDRAVSATKALFRNKGVKVVLELAQDLPPINGDMDRLIQVVINLLSNAHKFTPRGAVTCRTSIRDNAIEVRIIDTGQGISKENQEQVFNKFRQVGDPLTDKPTGTGLGLPICKQIIQSHDGIIGVDSELGKGSEFWFALPLEEADDIESSFVNLEMLKYRVSESPLPGAFGNQENNGVGVMLGTILLVDNDDQTRTLARAAMQDEGFTVIEAENDDKAAEALKQRVPNIIVKRFTEATPEGFQFAGTLAGNKVLKQIPMMMLSVKDGNDESHLMSLDRYFPNPVKAVDLVGELSHISLKHGPVRSVLVADDGPKLVQSLSDFLGSRGHAVNFAFDQSEALRLAGNERPDVIIAGALMAQRYNLVASLRFDLGLGNMNFILLGGNNV